MATISQPTDTEKAAKTLFLAMKTAMESGEVTVGITNKLDKKESDNAVMDARNLIEKSRQYFETLKLGIWPEAKREIGRLESILEVQAKMVENCVAWRDFIDVQNIDITNPRDQRRYQSFVTKNRRLGEDHYRVTLSTLPKLVNTLGLTLDEFDKLG